MLCRPTRQRVRDGLYAAVRTELALKYQGLMAKEPSERDGEKRPPHRSTGGVPNPMAMLGAGIEMGLTVGLMTLGGWWLDGKLGTSPWLLITGALLGTIGSIYNLWKQGQRQFKQPPRRNP